jgi:hypothetical protein
VPNATEYLVYGRTASAPGMYWTVTSPSFTDDGRTAGTAGTPPSTATVWQVKNLLELKHARHVRIDHNTFTNNWAQAQDGFAILFTPRNQNGTCPWCVVEDVVFERNIVRGVGSGINILGTDDLHPSQQANAIVIRHNQFYDLSKSWGGYAFFLMMVRGPRDVVVDHNTVISPDGSAVVNVDRVVTGFVFTNNVARHNAYGIIGANRSAGNDTIQYFFPGSTITRNVFAAGKASYYPAGNEFPSVADFQAHFVGYAGNDFRLNPGTDWERAGTDLLDLGAVISSGSSMGASVHADGLAVTGLRIVR